MNIVDGIKYSVAIISMIAAYVIMAINIGILVNDGILGAIIALAIAVVILILVVKKAQRDIEKRSGNDSYNK